MRRRLPLLAWLALVWLALWGDLSVANALSGLAVGALLLVAFPEPSLRWSGPLRLWRALVFHAYFLAKVCEATAIVAWEVATPWSRIREGIVGVPITGDSDAVTTVVANAITLTPGTLTLEVGQNPPTLFVHALHLHDVDKVRREVRRLEWLALLAYGSSEARRRGPPAAAPGASPEPTHSFEDDDRPGEGGSPDGRPGDEGRAP